MTTHASITSATPSFWGGLSIKAKALLIITIFASLQSQTVGLTATSRANSKQANSVRSSRGTPTSPSYYSTTWSASTSARQQPLTTPLLYSNGIDEKFPDIPQQAVQQQSSKQQPNDEGSPELSRKSFWWSSNPDTKKGEQRVVDEYLEFLERRYHRIHDDDVQVVKEKKSTAWDWIIDLPKGGIKHDRAQHQDALYALGVAQHASERLLQKHRAVLKPRQAAKQKGLVVEAKSSTVWAKPSPLIKTYRASKEVALQVRNILSLALKSFMKRPAVRVGLVALLKSGGGKQLLGIGLSLLTAAVVLQHPWISAMIKKAFV